MEVQDVAQPVVRPQYRENRPSSFFLRAGCLDVPFSPVGKRCRASIPVRRPVETAFHQAANVSALRGSRVASRCHVAGNPFLSGTRNAGSASRSWRWRQSCCRWHAVSGDSTRFNCSFLTSTSATAAASLGLHRLPISVSPLYSFIHSMASACTASRVSELGPEALADMALS